jgi:hypothetical protein
MFYQAYFLKYILDFTTPIVMTITIIRVKYVFCDSIFVHCDNPVPYSYHVNPSSLICWYTSKVSRNCQNRCESVDSHVVSTSTMLYIIKRLVFSKTPNTWTIVHFRHGTWIIKLFECFTAKVLYDVIYRIFLQ